MRGRSPNSLNDLFDRVSVFVRRKKNTFNPVKSESLISNYVHCCLFSSYSSVKAMAFVFSLTSVQVL